MQDNNLIDLSELDIFREREDGTGTYNDLRLSLGEPPVTSFMELTGGNAELAKELEIVYQGDVNHVDVGIGILAEPKPEGFALGFVQFYQFVLNAPRRIKSNRFLSEGYTYKEYLEGMNWVEHGGGFKGAIRRHLPKLAAQLEGVKRGFAPWKDTETFPERLLTKTQDDIGKAFIADLRTVAMMGISAGLAVFYGLSPLWLAGLLVTLVLLASITMAVTRLFARRFLQLCEKKCNTDQRVFMFPTLYRAENSVWIASYTGHVCSVGIILLAFGCMALAYHHSYAWISLLFGLSGLSALSTRNWAKTFTDNTQLLKIALRNRMRAGQPVTPIKPLGNLESHELDRLFRSYAPGRQYLTSYDFERLYEVERAGKSVFGKGKQWSKQILKAHADLIVEEDRELVPAITRDTYIRVLQGSAQLDLAKEKKPL